jgi:opacity protein-like surface antigen
LQFAYHVGAGISHALNDQVDFVIGGRYHDLGISRIDTGSGGSLMLKHSGFEARIGLRYKLEALKFGK